MFTYEYLSNVIIKLKWRFLVENCSVFCWWLSAWDNYLSRVALKGRMSSLRTLGSLIRLMETFRRISLGVTRMESITFLRWETSSLRVIAAPAGPLEPPAPYPTESPSWGTIPSQKSTSPHKFSWTVIRGKMAVREATTIRPSNGCTITTSLTSLALPMRLAAGRKAENAPTKASVRSAPLGERAASSLKNTTSTILENGVKFLKTWRLFRTRSMPMVQ